MISPLADKLCPWTAFNTLLPRIGAHTFGPIGLVHVRYDQPPYTQFFVTIVFS